LCPATVRAEFALKGDEDGLFIHHTYIMTELYEHLQLKVQSKTVVIPFSLLFCLRALSRHYFANKTSSRLISQRATRFFDQLTAPPIRI
jgi:hypothetical protein